MIIFLIPGSSPSSVAAGLSGEAVGLFCADGAQERDVVTLFKQDLHAAVYFLLSSTF